MARSNSFEGGSNGVALTGGSGGNTGGASGDFLDAVDAGTGTVAFSTAQAAHGTTSMLIATGGASSLAYAAYNLAAVTVDPMRGLFRLTSLPSVVQVLARYMSGAGQSLRINVKAAGTLEVRDSSNGVVGTTASAVLVGQWWRLEMLTTFGVGTGAVGLRLYNSPDSTTVTDSLTLSGLTLTASVSALRYGVGAAAANIPSTWIDDIAVEGTTWHGPAAQSITVSGIAVPVGLGGVEVDQDFAVTPTGIAVPLALGTPSVGGPVMRPDSGTTARPTTGTVTRPFTGTITRP